MISFLPCRQNFSRAVALITLNGILLACNNNPVVDPVDKQDQRITKVITAHYFRNKPPQAPGGVEQIITYQGIPFYLSYRIQVRYTYDQQKRLTQTYGTDFDYPGDSLSALGNEIIQYTGNKITYTNQRVFPLTPVTYTLNPDGYISDNRTYDSDGHLLEQKESSFLTRRTIQDGNVVNQVTETDFDRAISTFEYDLLHRSLPDPLVAQHGKPSRNLVLKTTSVNESLSRMQVLLPNRGVQVFSYEFDEKGRVSQQTLYIGDNTFVDQPIHWSKIEVATFEYN
ncbi:hypothetical protein BH09BAC4_BH09BAC4_38620 [soil metagenome]